MEEKNTFQNNRCDSAFKIAQEGYNFIFIAAFITIVFAIISLKFFAILGLITTIAICLFFRDPKRTIPEDENALVSPADGKIIFLDIVESNPYIEGRCLKISIFMSVLNVHINRVPFDGIVKKIIYFKGKFFNASFDKASTANERNAIIMETRNNKSFCFVQIAGLIARRIISYPKENESLKKGHRFGLICFGSRLDLYLPVDFEIRVKKGDKVQGASSILGYLR